MIDDSPRQPAAVLAAIIPVLGQDIPRPTWCPVGGMMLAMGAAVLATAVLAVSVFAASRGSRLHSVVNQGATTLVAMTVDPALAVLPRTVTQAADIGGMHLVLVANPVVPGENHFTLRLADRRGAIVGARVQLSVAMVGMRMEPLPLSATEIAPGRYRVTGLLTMFGRWQVSARVDRAGSRSITQPFRLSVDLPHSR
jgi:YtkA-like protein